MTLRISDHALVRFLDRAGGLDVEGLRVRIERALARAAMVADRVGARDYAIHADGLTYHVRDGTVVTVVPQRRPLR